VDSGGIAYLRGALPRADALAIADRVWGAYAEHGIKRDDTTTWPHGFQVEFLRRLRKRGVFKPFDNDTVRAAITEIIGEPRPSRDPWRGPLISFPTPGPWVLPKSGWHCDLAPRGSPDRPAELRMFGFVTDVAPQGGGTLVIEGSHELIRRMVAEAPDHDAGHSTTVKKRLFKDHPWFKAPSLEPTVIDGVTVRVRELTGQPGDVVFMLPWTLHNISMNCADQPRFMVTHTAYSGARSEGVDAEMASAVDKPWSMTSDSSAAAQLS
jgi:hypothetical protein